MFWGKGQYTSSFFAAPTHLVGAKEQDLGLGSTRHVNNLSLDTWCLTWKQQVDDGVDELFEAQLERGAQVGQDGGLGTTLHDQTVLLLLSAGQGVCFIEQGSRILVVVFLASRSHDSDTASSDILESNMETSEVAADDEEDAEGRQGVLDGGQKVGLQSERQCDLCV